MKPLYELSVSCSAEAEESLVVLLEETFQTPPSVYVDERLHTRRVTVYVPLATRDLHKARQQVFEGLRQIRRCGLPTGSARIRLRAVRREDWAESWKRHFRPLEVGPRLLIKPSWSRRQARPGQELVVLDPGLSFGTGQHATTRFCLEQLVKFRQPETKQSFWDVGTGSGILAIAAAKLGYAPVQAIDFDPEAVRVAQANAHQNRVLNLMVIEEGDLLRLPVRSPERYDLICANLTEDLLRQGARRLVARLKPQGRLVLAGILTRQFAAVERCFAGYGLRLLRSRREKEWRSGLFGRSVAK